MAQRRSLIEGLDNIKDVDPQVAEEFILDGKPRGGSKHPGVAPKAARPAEAEPPEPPPAPRPAVSADTAASSPLTGVGRVPVGARVRTELAASLKRASLERQLAGIQPNSIQEILEDSLELWLLKHGYVK